MLDKIKTLKEIIEPKASKLGQSFEEVLKIIDEEQRFDVFYKHLLKIKEAKRLKWSTKLYYGFYDIDKICKIYKDGYYSELKAEQKNKIQKLSDSIIDNFFKESRPFKHYRTGLEHPCAFIDLLDSRGLSTSGYNINQYGGDARDMSEYFKQKDAFINFKKLGKLENKYIINPDNYDEYISILKEAGFLFIEPIEISTNEVGRDDRRIYYKKAIELFKSIITPWGSDAINSFNGDDAINWINAHNVELLFLIKQQIRTLLVFKFKQKWNEDRWNIINYVDEYEQSIHEFIIKLNITSNQELKGNINKINTLIKEIVDSFVYS